MNVERMKPILLYSYIFPFSCWALDVIATFYAINILHVAIEMNPLGWPFGALGALTFYIPSFIFSYLLLFKIKNRLSLIVAVLETLLAFGFGVMNLFAGLHNVGIVQIYIGGGTSLIGYAEFFGNIFAQVFFWSVLFALVFFGLREILFRIGRRFSLNMIE
ncbi:MAG TPA: hypothetical protein VMS94_01385 [Acidobacteriota bacterium]|nr:hypothetical protein [Acidobacteriota bacterium]